MFKTLWTLHFGTGLELLLAKMVRIRELEVWPNAVPCKFRIWKVFLKQCLKKVFEKVWWYLQPAPRGILAFFHWVRGLDLERWRIQWASQGQASVSTILSQLCWSAVAVPHSHPHGEARGSGMWMQKHGLNYLSFAMQKFAFQHGL